MTNHSRRNGTTARVVVPPIRILLAVLLCFGANACLVRRAQPGAVADMSLITESEIDSAHMTNALEVIKLLRPMFLVSRGKLSLEPGAGPALPNVYVDNQFFGDATALRTIAASTIESIRFYSASDAQFKFGRGNEAGVIGIYTKH